MAELQARMSHSEFLDWMAFAEQEPLPEARADLRAAQQMALLANVNRDAKAHPTAYTAKDFLVDWWGERQEGDGGSLLQKFRLISERINANAAGNTVG